MLSLRQFLSVAALAASTVLPTTLASVILVNDFSLPGTLVPYTHEPGYTGMNALGQPTGSDRTMQADAIGNGTLNLASQNKNSYWYSFLNCATILAPQISALQIVIKGPPSTITVGLHIGLAVNNCAAYVTQTFDLTVNSNMSNYSINMNYFGDAPNTGVRDLFITNLNSPGIYSIQSVALVTGPRTPLPIVKKNDATVASSDSRMLAFMGVMALVSALL